MAIQTYILTIDDSELTEELCALLQRFGAKLEQQPEPTLTEADKRVLTERARAVEAGEVETYSMEEVFSRISEKHFGE